MSIFSGKNDLFDYISGLGGWFGRDGNPVKLGEANCYYSDETLDFAEFKRQTGGVIHQRKKVTVTEWNQEDVKNHCPGFDFTKHVRKIPDKRCKSKFREETYYTYSYYGKEYGSLKELNKQNVYVTIDINFDTLLDIIPYYPYIVSSCSHNGGSTPESCVFISDKPYPIKRMEERLNMGGLVDDSFQRYQRELNEHFRDAVLMIEGRKRLKSLVERISGGDDQELEKAVKDKDKVAVRKILSERNPDTAEVQFDRISEYWREENTRG